MTESNTVAEREMEQLGQKQGQQLEAAVVRGNAWSEQLVKKGANGKRLRDGGLKVGSCAMAFNNRWLTPSSGFGLCDSLDTRRDDGRAGSDLVIDCRL